MLSHNYLYDYRKLCGISRNELYVKYCENNTSPHIAFSRIAKVEKLQRAFSPIECINISKVLGFKFKDVFPIQYARLKSMIES